MSEHKGLPVHGYVNQNQRNVDLVNEHKQMEERILRQLDLLYNTMDIKIDQRWLAIGRTHIEQGFMAINRAVFKPERVKLSDDPSRS